MHSVRSISCEGRSPSSIQREAQEAALHSKSLSLNFVVSHETLRSLESVLKEQKTFGSSIVALNLSDSKLNVDSLIAVSALFAKSPLQTLVMERCGIDDKAAPILAEFMMQCPKLCTVNVRNNALSDAGAKLLHKSAVGHPCLQSVVCDGCPVSVRRQKQLSDMPKKTITGTDIPSVISPPAPTPHSTPLKMRYDVFDERRAMTMTSGRADMPRTPLSSIAESTRLEWSILTKKQQPSGKSVGRSSSVPRLAAPTSSSIDRRSAHSGRSITQEALDSMFSPTPRNVDNRISARSRTSKTIDVTAGRNSSRERGGVSNSSDLTKSDDFGHLLRDQQVAMLQSHCHSLETELVEQQQILKVEQARSSAAESQCLQLQHSRQQQTDVMAVMRKDLHRALNTVQAVTTRCTQLIGERNLFRDQKRSFEQLIGSFLSGVSSIGSDAPQHLSDAIESFAAISRQSLAKEVTALDEGNSELMDLLRNIWGNSDGSSIAYGEQPTPAIAKVARDFHMVSSTPSRDLQQDLLPQFSSLSKTSFFGDDSSLVAVDEKSTDAEFDDINRFLHSRVSSTIQHHGNATAVQHVDQARNGSSVTNSSTSKQVVPAIVEVSSKDKLLSPSKQAPPSSKQAPSAPATILKHAAQSGKLTTSPRSYEELQLQLHSNTAIPATALSAPSKERRSPTQTYSVLDNAPASAALLLDPVHDSETQYSIIARPPSAGKLQSSPHSCEEIQLSDQSSPVPGSNALFLMQPVIKSAALPQSTPAPLSVCQHDALSDSARRFSPPSSPNISSPKTYEELQIALQRGYSGLASAVTGMSDQHVQPSPNLRNRPSDADINQASGSAFSKISKMQDQQHANSTNRFQSSSKASEKLRSKQLSAKAQGTSSSSSSSSSRKSQQTVSTFNLPSSFFS
jgi:hypothetical protein